MRYIFGNSGFSREIEGLIRAASNYYFNSTDIFFIDEEKENNIITDLKNDLAYLGIGDCFIKNKIYEKFKNDIVFEWIVHPSSIISLYPQIEMREGTLIQSNCSLTVGIKIGLCVMVNLNCTIGHDTVIGDFCTINPGVNIAGDVKIGRRVNIGIGSNIIQGVSICDDVVLGAGSVVVRDITTPGTYVGVPARKIHD